MKQNYTLNLKAFTQKSWIWSLRVKTFFSTSSCPSSYFLMFHVAQNVHFCTRLISVTSFCTLLKSPTFSPHQIRTAVYCHTCRLGPSNMSSMQLPPRTTHSPVVVPFIDCISVSSSEISKSAFISLNKMSHRPESRTSRFSSKAKEKLPKLSAQFFSWSSEFPAKSSTRPVAAFPLSLTVQQSPKITS